MDEAVVVSAFENFQKGARDLSSDHDSHEIVVRSTHRLAKGLFTAAILMVWIAAGFSFASQSLLRGVAGTPGVIYLFFAMWLFATITLSTSLAWVIFGAQVASIAGSDLAVARKIGRTVIGKRRVFNISHVQDMRIEEKRYKARGKAFVRCTITFDYLGRRHGLFEYLSKEQAQSLMNGPLYKFRSGA